MQPTQNRVSIVVGERGANWMPWAERFRSDDPHVVLMLQRSGETAADFASRIRERLAELEHDGRTAARAVLVSGGRIDADAFRSRSIAIRAIAGAMQRAGGGEVTLGHSDDSADRFATIALAETVSELVQGTGVTILHHATEPATGVSKVA